MIRMTLRRSLRWGAVLAVAVAIVGGAVGLLVAGVPGLLGALVGAVSAGVFLALTGLSMLVAGRVTQGDLTNPAYYGIVLGSWFVKLLLFIGAAILVRGAEWLDARVFIVTVIVAVAGSLVVDMVAMVRTQREIDGPRGS
jgi:hypothetical protein